MATAEGLASQTVQPPAPRRDADPWPEPARPEATGGGWPEQEFDAAASPPY